MSTKTEQNNFLIINFIFSLIGAILVLFTDFAGWTERAFYITDYYVWIGSQNMPFYGHIFLILIVIGLLGQAGVAYRGIRGDESMENIEIGYKISIATLSIIILGTLIFIIQASNAYDWWLDTGFYSGLFGSLIPLIFFYLIRNEGEIIVK